MVSTTSEILGELEKILSSRWLRESQQLQALLRHIVQETLEGRADGLKEYALGFQVFHRPPDYDPRNDAIVRVQASLLRKRLTAYYEHEGRDSNLRIELPRGGYVPSFHTGPFETLQAPASFDPTVVPVPRVKVSWRIFAAGVLVGLLLGVSALYFLQRGRRPPVDCPALWGTFLQPGAETVVSFGVPLFFAGGGGLYVRDTEVNRPTDDLERIHRIAEILRRQFRPQEDVYTGIGDAIGTYSVATWLDRRGVRAIVGNSNYIGPSDIEGKNLVVVASARFQTLLQQMNLPTRIRFVPSREGGGYELDAPAKGELPFYRPSGAPGVSTSYAVVSLWPSSKPGRRLMYLSGVETWSTQGAAEFVLDPARLADLQNRLDADPAAGPKGPRSPFFQVLLRVEGKNNIVRGATYVTHRYLPARS